MESINRKICWKAGYKQAMKDMEEKLHKIHEENNYEICMGNVGFVIDKLTKELEKESANK